MNAFDHRLKLFTKLAHDPLVGAIKSSTNGVGNVVLEPNRSLNISVVLIPCRKIIQICALCCGDRHRVEPT